MSINIPATLSGTWEYLDYISILNSDSRKINLCDYTRVWSKAVDQAFVYMFLVPAEKEFETRFLFSFVCLEKEK